MYCGIDTSLNSTGYCVLNNCGDVLLAGVLKPDVKGHDRLLFLYKRIRIIHHRMKIMLTCIEGYAYSRHSSSIFQMGEAGGITRLALMMGPNPFLIVVPGALKKFATGKGNAKKDIVVAHYTKETGSIPKSNDEADAYFLARIAFGYDTYPHCSKHFNQKQFEVISDLRRAEGNYWDAYQ